MSLLTPNEHHHRREEHLADKQVTATPADLELAELRQAARSLMQHHRIKRAIDGNASSIVVTDTLLERLNALSKTTNQNQNKP